MTSVAIDATKVHAPYGFFACGVQLVTSIILLCWNHIGNGARLAAFCTLHIPILSIGIKTNTRKVMAGTAYLIQPVVFVWANKILARDGDDAARAVTLYAMNGMSQRLCNC